ncbi:MAG: hypothetical protein SH856_01855 [Flavobacteriales bacterium]|nr:hypothetical protein [Flavobacteriales bacterium]
MRKFVFIVFLSVCAPIMKGQYVPMIDETHTWKVFVAGFANLNETLIIAGDSLYNGILYKKCWTDFGLGLGFSYSALLR